MAHSLASMEASNDYMALMIIINGLNDYMAYMALMVRSLSWLSDLTMISIKKSNNADTLESDHYCAKSYFG